MRRVISLLFCLLCASTVLAASGHSGWYFSGDTFEADGIVYSVEGIGESRVLLGVGSKLIFIAKDDCVVEGLTEYCYTNYGNNVKYDAGEMYEDYYIEIRINEPKLTFTRDVSNTKPLPGEVVDVTFTIKNTGEYNLRDLVFEEILPEGVTIKSGPKQGTRTVYQERAAFSTDSIELVRYSFLVQNLDTFSVTPEIKYRYDTFNYNESGPQMSISVQTAYSVESGVTPTIELDQKGIYTLNVTNEHDDEVNFNIKIAVPEKVRVTSFENLKIAGSEQEYEAEVYIDKGETETFLLEIFPRESGTYKIEGEVSATIEGVSSTIKSDASFTSQSNTIESSMTISPSWKEYFSGTQITVRGILENVNAETRFNTITGKLVGKGLFESLEFSREKYSPGEKNTEAEIKFTAPNVNESTSFPISFTGKYKSPTGKTFSFENTNTIIIKPFIRKAEITRTITPERPERGGNVTVIANIANIYDTYITMDVTERIPNNLKRSSGLTFKELSLERGASEELYIYTIDIPANYTDDSFNITTVVRVKNDPLPEEHTTEIILTDAEEKTEDASEETDTFSEVEIDSTDEDEPGIFSRTWTGFKNGITWFIDAIADILGFGDDEPVPQNETAQQ